MAQNTVNRGKQHDHAKQNIECFCTLMLTMHKLLVSCLVYAVYRTLLCIGCIALSHFMRRGLGAKVLLHGWFVGLLPAVPPSQSPASAVQLLAQNRDPDSYYASPLPVVVSPAASRLAKLAPPPNEMFRVLRFLPPAASLVLRSGWPLGTQKSRA